MFNKFVFKFVEACSLWVVRLMKNTLQRNPFHSSDRKFDFYRKQASMARVPYNKFLTNLASSGRNGDYYMALSHKDWELTNAWIWLAEMDIDRGLDFPI